MPQTLRLGRFQFKDVDLRRVGQTVDGGTSLSGISDTIEADGGGYWAVDYANGFTRTAADGRSYRLVTDLGLTTAVDVVLEHERFFGPGIVGTVAEGVSPLTDGSELVTSTNYSAAPAPLRATQIVVAGVGTAPAMGPGMIFAINHSVWGWRTYRIDALVNGVATIRPPLRQAIGSYTLLDFNYPRCRMRLAKQPSNPTNIGRIVQCALTFVEDMRQPS